MTKPTRNRSSRHGAAATLGGLFLRRTIIGATTIALALTAVPAAEAHYANNPKAKRCGEFGLDPGEPGYGAFAIRAYRASSTTARSLAYKKLGGSFQVEPPAISGWRCIHRYHEDRGGFPHSDWLCRKPGGRRITFFLT